MTTAALSPGHRLRETWSSSPLILPGVFNALVARLAEQLGFQAVYLSGAALSASHGVPDVGLLSLTEFADAARSITQATTLPLVCDADTGFGEALNVERTVRQLEAAGVAGLHLEDQVMPKRCGHLSGKSVVEAAAMAAKIRAAVAARRDPSFVIIARTDARGVLGFEEAVRRGQLYLEAGADVLFPEALETPEEFERYQREVPATLLANMTEFGKSPNLEAAVLGKMGYRIILYPVTTLRVAMHAVEGVLRSLLAQGHQREQLPHMMTRAELYDLLGYAGYEARDKAYFG